MKSVEEKIELRSEEFQEVLSNIPPWILRWGITVLASIIVILLVGSAFFKYPDVLSSQVVLTGSTPPAVIVAKVSGKLKELYVTDNQEVKTGDYLAVIENPAKTEDVLNLKSVMAGLIRHPIEQLDTWGWRVEPAMTETSESSLRYARNDTFIGVKPAMTLGPIQSFYSAFRTTLHEFSEYNRLQYYPQKIAMSKARKIQLEKQFNILINQQKLTEEQMNLVHNKFERDSILSVKGMISNEEFENSRNVYLQNLISYENVNSSVNSMQIQIGQLEESLFDASYQDIEIQNNLQTRLQTQLSQLQAEILNWELNYPLVAPIDGKITFTNYWVENQNISAGSAVFTIVPDGIQSMIGKAMLPVARSGKVKVGQKVNIRLQNFPENEYGILRGTVKNISLTPTEAGGMAFYSVEITLNNGLITTYKKELPYLSDMQGRADIITEDISLLERLIFPMKKILKEGMSN